MTFTLRPAIRQQVPLLIGVTGGTGCGKTMSALRMAKGICGEKKFAFIDTENGRGLHYADQFDFDHGDLRAPFRPESYIDAILACDRAGYPVIVVDSMSHVWAGDGGILDWQEEELDRMAGNDYGKREKCKMASWIAPKQAHKQMVQKLLQVKAHVILCFRAEPKIEMVREGGKTIIQAKQSLTGLDGWIPICDKMLPFELTVSFLMTADRPGYPKPIKLQEQHKPMFPLDQPLDENSGFRIAQWAAGGISAPPSIKKRLQEALNAAQVTIEDFLTKTRCNSLEDVEEQHVEKALSWIAKRGAAKQADPARAEEITNKKSIFDIQLSRIKKTSDTTILDVLEDEIRSMEEFNEYQRKELYAASTKRREELQP